MSVPPSGCFGLNFNEGSLPRPCSKIQTDRKSQRGWENVRQIANTLEKEKKKHLNKKGRNLLSSRPGPAGSRRDTSRQNVHAASPSQDHFPADPNPQEATLAGTSGPSGVPTPTPASLGCVLEIRQKCSQMSTFEKVESFCNPSPSERRFIPTAHQSPLSLVPRRGK